MAKPDHASGYDAEVTKNCERVLVTLLRGLGPWKNSVCLVGGLTPRYLVGESKKPHAGTGDVDIVVELGMLTDTEAYRMLEYNLKRMEFERAENSKGEKVGAGRPRPRRASPSSSNSSRTTPKPPGAR
jgi:hypothetical protein